MTDHGFMEREDSLALREAFAGQATEGAALAPVNGQAPAATDGVIVAQKVAVERDTTKVLQKLKTLANVAGEKYYYRFPVKNRGETNWIEGPSIKLANDLAREYGNCQVDVRAFDIGDSWMFYARFVDVETGYSLTRAFQQRKDQATLKTKDKGRALDIVFQIGQSKAIRNVVVNALETFADYALDEAKATIAEKIQRNPDKARERIHQILGQLGVDVPRVESHVGRKSGDWQVADMARVISEAHAIRDGMTTADEVWPPKAPSVGADDTATPAAPTRADFKEEKPKEQAEQPKADAVEVDENGEPELPKSLDRRAPKIPTPTDPFNARAYDWEAFETAFLERFDKCETAEAIEELFESCQAQFDNMFPADRQRFNDIKAEKLADFEDEQPAAEPV